MAIDALLTFQLDLFRLDADTRARVLPILTRLERELVGQHAGEKPLTEYSKKRVDALLAETRAVVKRYYDEAQRELFETTRELGPISARAAAGALDTALPVTISAALPPDDALRAIAGDIIIQGATQAGWWAKQEADTAFRFAAAVRQGLVAGETNAQIIQRVAGKAGFPGVMEIARNNAAALVQTSVASVANEARMATFAQNEDLIARYRWLTALDSHVCEQCAALADQTWEPGDESMPRPPLHFNDRCVLTPETKTWRELGIDLPEPPDGMRASRDGPVPASTTFREFLDRQSPAFQDEVLGPGRAALYRDGKITLADLVNGRGNPLTLKELRERYE